MKTYLKIINPTLAVLVLLLCTWSAVFDKGTVNFAGIIAGGFGSYFFAKGIFAFSSLVLLGKILLEIQEHRKSTDKSSNIEWRYMLVLLLIAIGMLYSLLMMSKYKIKEEKNIKKIENPEQLVIMEQYIVRESDDLKITGKIKNNSKFKYYSLELSADIFIGGRYSDNCTGKIRKISAGSEKYFTIECHDLENNKIKDEIKYKIHIEGTEGEK